MTNHLALVLFGLSFAAGLYAAVLALVELRGQMRALRKPVPPEPVLPMSFNEHIDAVRAILAGRTPAMVLLQTREVFNEIIAALGDEVALRKASDERLAGLVAAPRSSRRLLATICAVVIASVLGGLGDLVATLDWRSL